MRILFFRTLHHQMKVESSQVQLQELKNIVPETPKKKNPKKRKHEEQNEMLTEAFKILTEPSQATDPYFSYGQHIGNELRKYDNHTLT